MAKRTAIELSVPAADEDAKERKRVLNVLAQRRYRQRRRQLLQDLVASNTPVAPVTDDTGRDTTLAKQSRGLEIETPESHELPAESPNLLSVSPELARGLTSQTSDGSSVVLQDLGWLSDTILPSPTLSVSNFSFPDERHLDVPELNLLRGATSIAVRLNIAHLIWSLSSKSPFSDPTSFLDDYSHLPLNLQPTICQRNIDHHPIIDLLPWPTVRDKLILAMCGPPETRPPATVIDFVYDIEDSSEGVRIWGEDPYSDRHWEIGQKVYERWWWAFDADIVKKSNQARLRRGARMLSINIAGAGVSVACTT